MTALNKKILSWQQAKNIREKLKNEGQKLAFTNGCFDLLHPGHLRYLAAARKKADYLIVGLNSDDSIKKLKGEKRPICPQNVRSEMLAGLWAVDGVVVFNELTPLELINILQPDFLIKGGDWALKDIIGAQEVKSWGGTVLSIKLAPGFSTTNLIRHIRENT